MDVQGNRGQLTGDLGREFTARGETFRITGLNPNRPKYPIDVERLPDRRAYKFPADLVAVHLKASRS